MEKKEIQFKQGTWITVAVTPASKVCEAAQISWITSVFSQFNMGEISCPRILKL